MTYFSSGGVVVASLLCAALNYCILYCNDLLKLRLFILLLQTFSPALIIFIDIVCLVCSSALIDFTISLSYLRVRSV